MNDTREQRLMEVLRVARRDAYILQVLGALMVGLAVLIYWYKG